MSALRPILGELQLDFVVAHLEAHDVQHGEPSYILDALISSRMWATAALIKTGGTASVQPHLRDLDVMLTYHLSEYGAPQGAWGYSDVLMTEWMAYAYRNALLDRCAVRHALGRENAEVDCEAAELITLDIDMIRDAEPRSAYFANSTQTP